MSSFRSESPTGTIEETLSNPVYQPGSFVYLDRLLARVRQRVDTI